MGGKSAHGSVLLDKNQEPEPVVGLNLKRSDDLLGSKSESLLTSRLRKQCTERAPNSLGTNAPGIKSLRAQRSFEGGQRTWRKPCESHHSLDFSGADAILKPCRTKGGQASHGDTSAFLNGRRASNEQIDRGPCWHAYFCTCKNWSTAPHAQQRAQVDGGHL